MLVFLCSQQHYLQQSVQKKPKCPSTDEWINKMQYIHKVEYYLTLLFVYFNWRLITLQYFIGFAIPQHESATGIHVFPNLNPASSSLPVPSLWVVSVHQPQASSIMHRTWTGNSFHVWYYTCFNAVLPNHSTLSLSFYLIYSTLHIQGSPQTWKQQQNRQQTPPKKSVVSKQRTLKEQPL